jgi:hypothetical protein
MQDKCVAFCGEDKVALREAADFVRPNLDAESSPSDMKVRVMPLLFCCRTDAGGGLHRFVEVRERVRAGEKLYRSMLSIGALDDVPRRIQLGQERLDLLAGQRRHAPAARNALALRKLTLHDRSFR